VLFSDLSQATVARDVQRPIIRGLRD